MAISGPPPRSGIEFLQRKTPSSTRPELVAGGLGAHWPQFPTLLPQIEASHGMFRTG